MYNDEILVENDIAKVMNTEFSKSVKTVEVNQVEVCEVGEFRQLAEVEEIYKLLKYAEGFLNWLEREDKDEDIKRLLELAQRDLVTAEGCCNRHGLDYRYACEKDFHQNCSNYCKCEMELIDRVIKLLSLKNSIVDKQCMMKLLQSRMDTLRLIFGKYCK